MRPSSVLAPGLLINSAIDPTSARGQCEHTLRGHLTRRRRNLPLKRRRGDPPCLAANHATANIQVPLTKVPQRRIVTA